MTHPTQEQWMDFLYGEMPSPRKIELESHLAACAECRARQADFRAATQALDAWQVRPRHAPARRFAAWMPPIKWAAAAALLATATFGAGRRTAPSLDPETLRAEVARQVESRVVQEVQTASERILAETRQVSEQAMANASAAHAQRLEQFAASLAALRQEDQQTVLAALRQLDSDRQAEDRSLRQDLERVALFSDRSFKSAQRQLVQLTGYASNLENTPKN